MLPAGPIVPGVERLAVLRANAIGDLVVALPALEALRAAYPDAEITLLGKEHHEPLLLGRPSPVDRVVVLPPGLTSDDGATMEPEARAAVLDDLAGYRWDLAIQLHGGGRNSNPVVERLRPRVSVGSRTADAPALDRWIPYERFQWEIGRYLEIVALAGARPVVIEPRLRVLDQDRDALAAALPALGPPYAVLHPGATDPRRRWPVDSFVAVGRELRAAGRRPVVTGVPAEASLTEALAQGLGGDVLLADALSLPALLALLAGADVVVSNDTGPLHLAMAVGTSTVGIFWVGNLINAGPLTRRRHRPFVSWQVACPSCGVGPTEDRCPHDVSFVASVSVEPVVAAARSLIGAA